MSIFKTELEVDVIEFAIRNRDEIFSMSIYKKESSISQFKLNSERQMLKRCFWYLRDNDILLETNQNYNGEVDIEECVRKNEKTGESKKFSRRKNTTHYFLNPSFTFKDEHIYSKSASNALARLILTMIPFPQIQPEEHELKSFDIVNDILTTHIFK